MRWRSRGRTFLRHCSIKDKLSRHVANSTKYCLRWSCALAYPFGGRVHSRCKGYKRSSLALAASSPEVKSLENYVRLSMPKYVMDESGCITNMAAWTQERRQNLNFTTQKTPGSSRCPVCGQRPKRLAKHMRKMHSEWKGVAGQQQQAPPPQPQPSEQVALPPRPLSRPATTTMQRTAPIPQIPSEQLSIAGLSVQCNLCGQPFSPDELPRHKEQKHPATAPNPPHPVRSQHQPQPPSNRTTQQKGKQQRRTAPPKTSTESRIKEQSLEQSFRDPLDASRGLGHRYRDRGRYGSPSVRDGYDDESDAD